MKIFITLFFLLSSFIVKGQEIDSAWVSKNIVPKFVKDTGLFLPDASFIDEKGNTRLLSEFKGKVLLIDIWTTWCGNCIIRFPHSEQLYNRLKSIQLDTAIQFINICTEDSKSEWKKMLKKHQPVGVNLYSKDTSIYQSWNVSAFPRYILVDRYGKILSDHYFGPDDGMIDYTLYAAVKERNLAEAVWIFFRQGQNYQQYRKFSDDEEGADYALWYNSIVKELVAYFQWKQKRKE